MSTRTAPLPPAAILLVVADPRAREALRALLVADGYAVTSAADLGTALQHLENDTVDLLLHEVLADGRSGMELTVGARQLGLYDLTVILFSANASASEVVRALDSGADDFVRTSDDPRELLARVRAHARVRDRHSQRARDCIFDPLTNLLNRRGIAELFVREQARIRRHGGFISLLVLDIDDFKPINDLRGHAAGDRILQGLSRALERAVRASDAVGRLGGDEFIVLMPSTDAPAAARLRERIEALAPVHVPLGAHEQVIRFSVGVASGASCDLETLLARADEGMYRDKRGGVEFKGRDRD